MKNAEAVKNYKAHTTLWLNLLADVDLYIRCHGGSANVIGPIEVHESPGDLEGEYTLAIKITGRKPNFAREKEGARQ